MDTDNFSEFEVTDHYFLEERGGFLIGRIYSGQFKVGMTVPLKDDRNKFTIAGIEFVDNLAEKSFKNALIFSEKPDLEYLKRMFPLGSILKAYE